MTLESVRNINSFFKSANRSSIDNLLSKIVFSERQEKIFNMFYIKKYDIGFIADMLNVCESVIKRELRAIRIKICPYIENK